MLRLLKDDYALPHAEAFLDEEAADFHFRRDVIYYRKKGWEVDVDDACAGDAVSRAFMTRRGGDVLDRATLVLERYEIVNE